MEKPVFLRLDQALHTLIIADGMGGQARGELASRTAVEAFTQDPTSLGNVADCVKAVRAANDRIYDVMQSVPDSRGMGTTIAGTVISGSSLICFNVGDSRVYRFIPPRLVRLSQDDVPASEQNSIRTTHFITQCLGGHDMPTPVQPHVRAFSPLEPNEFVMLCSDGLSDLVTETDIAKTMEDHGGPLEVVHRLFQLAMQAGGFDNISIIGARLCFP
jgi:serine/threonine protein phosphatase PrpC